MFYSTGGVAAVWCLAWFLLARDMPEQCVSMSQKELELITTTRTFQPGEENKEAAVPLLPLLASVYLTSQ